jgi:hypothetical protein
MPPEEPVTTAVLFLKSIRISFFVNVPDYIIYKFGLAISELEHLIGKQRNIKSTTCMK